MADPIMVACLNCGTERDATGTPAEFYPPAHCSDCPPWRCEDCGDPCSMADACRCWVSVEDLPLADLKAIFATADLNLTTPATGGDGRG